jgi:PPOX class probable F420-dependent enzyme
LGVELKYQDLLTDEKRAFAVLGTLMEDGTPQVTPVWFSYDGNAIYINSAAGRIKDRNMKTRPHIALTVLDPDNPYRYMQVRGRVVEITNEGAEEHINALSYKYTGNPQYQGGMPGEVRVKYKIEPVSVASMG